MIPWSTAFSSPAPRAESGSALTQHFAAQGHRVIACDLQAARTIDRADPQARVRRRGRRADRARTGESGRRSAGRADQQRGSAVRRAARGISAGEVAAADRCDADWRGVADARDVAGDAPQRLRPHRQHRLDSFAGRVAVQERIRRREARPRRFQQERRAGDARLRHHDQHGVPELCEDAAGRYSDRSAGRHGTG